MISATDRLSILDSQSNFHLRDLNDGNSTCSWSGLAVTIVIIKIMMKIMMKNMMTMMTSRSIIMIIMMSSGAVFRVLCATQRPMGGRYEVEGGVF